MSEAAAQPAPEPPSTLEEAAGAVARAVSANTMAVADATTEMAALRKAVMASPPQDPEAARHLEVAILMLERRIGDTERAVIDRAEEFTRAVRQVTLLRTFEEMTQPAAPEPEPRRARHRRPRPSGSRAHLALWRAQGLAVAAGAVIHRAGVHKTAAAAIGTALAGTAAVVAVAPPSHAPPVSHVREAPAPAQRANIAAAVPLRPSRSSVHARPGAALAAGGSPAPSASPPPLPPPAIPVPSPLPAAGTLDVSTVTLELGLARQGTEIITAMGGPVAWSALPDPAQCLDIQPSSGRLAQGQSATVRVSVDPGCPSAAGPAYLALGPRQVTVTWASGGTAQV